MDNDKKENLSPEEQKAEEEMLSEAKSEDVRTKIIEELGLSEDDNKELIDKLVTKEVDQRKMLSTAVRQKIDWRNKAQGTSGKPEENKVDTTNMTPEQIQAAAEEKIRAEFEARDLASLNLSETITEQVKTLAKVKGVSVTEAAKDPYIATLVEQEKSEARAAEAADNGSGSSKRGVSIDTSKPLDASDFDFSTEEGRKAWSDAKKARQASQRT